MKNLKLKMFGKNSVSTLLFWFVILCLAFVLILFVQYLLVLLQGEKVLFLLNILPIICCLALLIPLALILNTFRKEKIFTKQSVKYLNLFGIFNILVIPCNILTAISLEKIIGISFFDEFINLIHVFGLNVLLTIFALFIAAIFKQGFQLQEENDLTI